MSNGNTTLALALGAGAGLGLWYWLGRDDDPKAAPTTNAPTAAPAPSPGAAASKPCALRLDANGITSAGVPLTVSGAVAHCKAAGGADVTIVGNAPSTIYADLVAAFRAAGIAIREHRNGRPRRPGAGDLATLRKLAARVRAASSARQGSKRQEATAKLARFVARHSGAQVEDQATIDFENNVVVSGAEREMRKVAAWVERLARGTGRAVSATVETLEDPDDPESDWSVCRIRGLGLDDGPGERNATSYRHFTLRTYPKGARGGGATLRWFRADPPVTWATARDRLIAAGLADAEVAGRTHEPGGWMLSVDPRDYADERADRLP